MVPQPDDPQQRRPHRAADIVGDMTSFGVADRDVVTEIFMRALQQAEVSYNDMRDLADEDGVHAAFEILVARGLLRQDAPAVWSAMPPEDSLAEYADRLVEEAQRVRAHTPVLARLYREWHAAPQGPGPPDVELLTSMSEVNQAMTRLFAETDRQVISMRTSSPRVMHVINSDPARNRHRMRNAHGDALQMQAVFDTALLGNPQLPAHLEARLQVGDELRFVNGVPFTATSNDTGTTVMDVASTDEGPAALRIRHSALSEAIRRVVDGCWQRGVRWHGRDDARELVAAPLDPRDRDILDLMLNGAADANVARQLGVSQRTVERRVRRVMELLGADTRFQAGVQAARRGWV